MLLLYTKPCKCMRTIPATITRTEDGQVKGYCSECIPKKKAA